MYFLEEKRDFSDCECFALKGKELNLITELINRHAETCKQVVIIKRIKQTNKKTSAITFRRRKAILITKLGVR